MLETMPSVFARLDDHQMAQAILDAVLRIWDASATDGDGAVAGQCLSLLLRARAVSADTIHRVHDQLLLVLSRPASQWSTTWKSALQVLNVLAALIPGEVLADVDASRPV